MASCAYTKEAVIGIRSPMQNFRKALVHVQQEHKKKGQAKSTTRENAKIFRESNEYVLCCLLVDIADHDLMAKYNMPKTIFSLLAKSRTCHFFFRIGKKVKVCML